MMGCLGKTISTPHLVSLFKAKAEVNELKALVISAPENVAGLEVSMYVTFPVQEAKGLQNITGTVLNQPHGMPLITHPGQQF